MPLYPFSSSAHHCINHRVSKRMKALSALLHWEHSLARRGVAEWLARTAGWHTKWVPSGCGLHGRLGTWELALRTSASAKRVARV
jgi:hypothetical protein